MSKTPKTNVNSSSTGRVQHAVKYLLLIGAASVLLSACTLRFPSVERNVQTPRDVLASSQLEPLSGSRPQVLRADDFNSENPGQPSSVALAGNRDTLAGMWNLTETSTSSSCPVELTNDLAAVGTMQKANAGGSCPLGLFQIGGWKVIGTDIVLYDRDGRTLARLRGVDPNTYSGNTLQGNGITFNRQSVPFTEG